MSSGSDEGAHGESAVCQGSQVAANLFREFAMKSKVKHRMFSTQVDIEPQIRENLIENLNESLANAFDLKSMYKQAHWNVKGIHFIELHLLFDEAAAEMGEFQAQRVTLDGRRDELRAGELDFSAVNLGKREASEAIAERGFVVGVDILPVADVDGDGHAGGGDF